MKNFRLKFILIILTLFVISVFIPFRNIIKADGAASVSVSAGNNIRKTPFNIGYGQNVVVAVSGNAGSGWYVQITGPNNFIWRPSLSVDSGYYGISSLDDSDSRVLAPGQYTLEVYGGRGDYKSGDISATVHYVAGAGKTIIMDSNSDSDSRIRKSYYFSFPIADSTNPGYYYCPGGDYNFNSNIKCHRAVSVNYSFSRDSKDTSRGHYPYLQLIVYDINTGAAVYSWSSTDSASGSLILNLNQYVQACLYTGEWNDDYWNLSGHHDNYKPHKCSATIIYYLDTTPPNTPTLQLNNATNINGSINPLVYYSKANQTWYSGMNGLNGMQSTVISWANPGDAPGTPTSPMSGVQTFEISDSNESPITFNPDNINNAEYSFSTEGLHTIQVRTVDWENNKSSWSSPMKVFIDSQPPTGLTIPAVNGVGEGQFTNDATLNWSWSAATDSGSGLQGYKYRISTQPKGSDDPVTLVDWTFTTITSISYTPTVDGKYFCEVVAVDNVNNSTVIPLKGSVYVDHSGPSVTWAKDPCLQNGKVTVFWNKGDDGDGIGVDSKKPYVTYLTKSPNPPDLVKSPADIVEADTVADVNATQNTFNATVPLDGSTCYYAWVWGIDQLGNQGAWAGPLKVPSFYIQGQPGQKPTNQTTYQDFRVISTIGKTLSFEVCYEKPGQDDSLQILSGDKPDTTPITFPEGKWIWYLQVYECDAQGKIQGTMQSSGKYDLTVDTTAPNGSFSITTKDGKTDLTGFPAKNPDVLITLISSSFTDDGLAPSGVKGFYLWNGSSDGNQAIDQAPPEGTSLITDLSSAIDWTLPNGDGQKYVHMLIVDNANNSTQINKVVGLDQTAPNAPSNFSYCFSADRKNVTVRWNSKTLDGQATDISKFFGSYIINPDGTSTPVTEFTKSAITDFINGSPVVTGYEGSVTWDISNLGPNQPLTLKVKAEDQAGNDSNESTYVIYTPASCGTLSDWKDDYNSSDGLYFTCTLNGGNADHQVLELCPNQQFSSTDTTIIPCISGQFRATGLNQHGSYYYRVVAISHPAVINGVIQTENPNQDETYSDFTKYTVPYCKPTFDIATFKPKGFATYASNNNIYFVIGTVNETNSDQLSYEVWWAEGANPSQDNFILANQDQNNQYYLPNPVPGKTYTWYVKVIDLYNGQVFGSATSDLISFTVDTTKPVVTLDQLSQPYTNQKSLEITVNDDLSGIADITYNTGGKGNTLFAPDQTGLLAWNGNITLPEGKYTLTISAKDYANNITTSSVNVQVDWTKPVLSNESISLNTKGNSYVSAGTVPVSWHATDNLSGIKGMYYWLVKQIPGDLSQLPCTKNNFTANNDLNNPNGIIKTDFNANLQLSGTNGDTFYLIMAVMDQAGNLSNKFILNYPILLDKTPPIINSFTIGGFSQYGSGYYLTNPNNLILTDFTANEDISDILVKKYSLVDTSSGNEQIVVDWTDNWQDIQKTVFNNGKSYRIKAEAIDSVGLTSETSSHEFVYDSTAPVNIAISGPTGELCSDETTVFNVSATAANSPIVAYYLAIGTEKGGTELTAKIPGNQNGWIVLPMTNSTGTIRLTLPTTDNGNYYPVLKVRNAAGNESTPVNGNKFTINNNQSKLIVHDQGPYTSRNDQLIGWWEYHGSNKVTGYTYRILGPGKQEIYPWQTTQATQITVQEPGLTFISGNCYQFEVKAIFADGNQSSSVLSPGVTVDTNSPVITKLITDDYSTSWNLQLNWDGNDAISGVARAQVAVGTSPYQSDISKGWLDIIGNKAKLSCDVNGDDLHLNTGSKYYLTLRLTNGAGLSVEQASSCVIIDNTPPVAPLVVDQGKYINTDPNQPMEAQWVWSQSDPESSTIKYEWAIVESPDQINQATWHDVGTQTQITTWMDDAHRNDSKCYFQRMDGTTYYFAVRATNGAGLSSIGFSDGILTDAKAPMIPEVKLLQGINLDPASASDVNYINNLNNLNLAIKSWAASGIDKVEYAWGTSDKVDDRPLLSQDATDSETVITLNNLPYSDFVDVSYDGTNIKQNSKQIIFLGQCISGADNSAAAYSSGVKLETGAPAIAGVIGYRSGNQYYFDWNINLNNSVSPLDHCEVALVSGQDLNGDSSSWNWETVGLSRKYQITIDEIPEGQYYLVVRGVNKANVASRREFNEYGISPLIVIDYTPPVITKFLYPKFVNKQLQFHIETSDQVTGIGGYQYALGSLSGSQAYTNGWLDIDRLDGTIDYIADATNIVTNTPVYLTVRVKDGAGNWTIPGGISQLILVDHTPPFTPDVTCGAYTNKKQLISGISFSTIDPESGVTQYQMAIVDRPDAQLDMGLPLLSIEQFNGVGVLDHDMVENGQYYIAVRTYNGAGIPSVVGYSKAITVDTIPPVIFFTGADNRIVTNPLKDSDPPLKIEYKLSEDASVVFTLTAADGSSQTITLAGTTGLNYFMFKESKPQVYTLSAIAIDPADNSGTTPKSQSIRVNAAPVVTLPDQISVTPGQPLTLQAVVYDPDGETGDILSYTWNPGDNGQMMSGTAPKYKYTKLGNYDLTVTVTDKDGGVTTVTTPVVVHNTFSGSLYMNETWSGEWHTYGNVTVPARITLTISPGTRVIIDNNPDTGYNNALIIQGTLNVQNGVSIDSGNYNLQSNWKGIIVTGQAELQGATITHALRGLLIGNTAYVTVTDCNFIDNYVGIHVYGTNPVITGTQFTDNQWYGIKEDQGGKPVVTNCGFSENEVDYYQDKVTEITIDELNQIPGNSGNHN
jgi:hypothetical protein